MCVLPSALDEIISLLEYLAPLLMHAMGSLLLMRRQAYIEEVGWHSSLLLLLITSTLVCREALQ